MIVNLQSSRRIVSIFILHDCFSPQSVTVIRGQGAAENMTSRQIVTHQWRFLSVFGEKSLCYFINLFIKPFTFHFSTPIIPIPNVLDSGQTTKAWAVLMYLYCNAITDKKRDTRHRIPDIGPAQQLSVWIYQYSCSRLASMSAVAVDWTDDYMRWKVRLSFTEKVHNTAFFC